MLLTGDGWLGGVATRGYGTGFGSVCGGMCAVVQVTRDLFTVMVSHGKRSLLQWCCNRDNESQKGFVSTSAYWGPQPAFSNDFIRTDNLFKSLRLPN